MSSTRGEGPGRPGSLTPVGGSSVVGGSAAVAGSAAGTVVRRRRWALVLLGVLLVVLVVEAYYPFHFRWSVGNWDTLWPQSRLDAAAAVLKMLVFVPVGVLLVLQRTPRPRVSVVAAAVLVLDVVLVGGKMFVEQRHPGVADLVTQFVGAVLGASLAMLLTLRPGGRHKRY
ncbi:MAG: hypothetical protein ACRDYU_14550 [Actinomycetes bacterium]